MTDRPARRRASKRELRGWAWIAGGMAFLAPAAALGAAPKPPVPDAGRRPVEIIRTITRRVIITEPPAEAPVRYVLAPSGGSTGAVVASSSGGSNPAPPPAATSTGGS